MKKRLILALPLVMLLSGCNIIKNLVPSNSKDESSFSSDNEPSSEVKTSTTSVTSDNPSGVTSEEIISSEYSSEEQSSEESSEYSSSEQSSEEEPPTAVEGGWSVEIKEAMMEYIGELLPYAPLNEETIVCDYYDYPESGFAYLSIYDDNEVDVLENYGLLLLDTGYTEDDTIYMKQSANGKYLQVLFGYIEADEDDSYESGNSIDVYIYDEDPLGSSSQSDDTSDSSSVEPSSQEPAEIITQTYDFTNTTITAGSNLSTAEPLNKLKTFMNSDREMVTNIEQDNCTFQNVPQDPNKKTVLCVGTNAWAGSITFDFSYQITQISFVLQGYCKYIDYNGAWSMDANSMLSINGHEYALGSPNENPPELVEDTIYFDDMPTSLTFENNDAGQRAFIYSLTVEMVRL